MTSVLALDLATHTGFACRDENGSIDSGVWLLDFGKGRPWTCRQLNLWARLELLSWVSVTVVEKPIVYPGRESGARVAYGLAAVVEMWAEACGIEYREIAAATVKRHATGRGNCDKAAMVAAARVKWPEIRIADDNHADALWLMDVDRPSPRSV